MPEDLGRRVRTRLGAVLHGAADRLDRRAADSVPSQRRLQERLAHLEALVEGLQDAVHREAVRQDKRIGDIERKLEPEEVARALSEDARRRGL